MSFRACAIVPCYNHGATAGAVIERLVAYGLDTLVIDDGSDEATAQVLRAHLATTLEPSVLPRSYRFVEALPYDERGKLKAADIERLFAEKW